MAESKQRIAAQKFAKQWEGKGYEKGQSQPFWLSLLRDVYGVERPESYISFEDQVHLDHTSFIDGYIAQTKVMIEQKSLGKSLNAAIKQSDGSLLNPFQQAKRYITELPLSKHPRFVVTCNFEEFYVYDMERPHGEPEIIKLADLPKEYYRLSFLVDEENIHLRKEMEVSIKAGEIVGLIYDALLKQYINKENEETLKSLNKLCVRLVFCLYAEDAGIFGKQDMFLDYMKQFETKHFRKALIDLFRILDTKTEDRDPYLEEELAAFPYVNGGLFADEVIEIPMFTDEIRELILTKASADFDWSEISPTIFGAVFESTLNPETRRKGGMHYTSIENIHKVIDPLFMYDLNKEFEQIKEIKQEKNKNKKLEEFQNKIANLTFLDPACGSGNFLTETYISLRKLENEILFELLKGQITLGAITNPIKVSISQFYGIEINDFAVTVAKTALWIAESQMMKKTEDIVHMDLDFLPLKTYTNIVEGNALRIDWEDVVDKGKLNYIMGNPPFVGASMQTKEQKEDIMEVYKENGKNYSRSGKLDYVAGWYFKAAQLMHRTNIETALVSTNSVCQGELVEDIWKPIYEKYDININFAHQTFIWDSESSLKAHVHCVIIGFSCTKNNDKKKLYSNERMQFVENINAYLINAPNIFIQSRKNPISNVFKCSRGNQPTDGGNLIIESCDYSEFITKEPLAKKYIKRLIGSQEFINSKERYCLWLVNVSPSEIKHMPLVMDRISKVKAMRLASTFEQTRELANKPTTFRETLNPASYIVIPRVSSERRKYIPMGFLDSDTIPTDSVIIIPDATIYYLGILTSNIHMAWVRAFCGRLKSDYRYSKDIVYNNFPWCSPTEAQRAKIEKTAQEILDARALYPECSLADLYDELTMPPELRCAHQENDKAVMEAYGFYEKNPSTNKRRWLTESETIAKLMEMYKEMTSR